MSDCPVKGCSNARKLGHVMCSDCWYVVSKATRDRVWKHYRADPFGEEHLAAIDQAREEAQSYREGEPA